MTLKKMRGVAEEAETVRKLPETETDMNTGIVVKVETDMTIVTGEEIVADRTVIVIAMGAWIEIVAALMIETRNDRRMIGTGLREAAETGLDHDPILGLGKGMSQIEWA
jgi:hypothetical protein